MSDFMFVSFPLALIAYSICRLRGIWRIAAIGCLVAVLPSWVADMQGIQRGGNLAGINTMILARPVLVFLFILHGTYIAANKSRCLQNAAIKYTVAALSSVFLFGGVVYLLSFPIPFPFVGQLLGRLPDVLYWTVGGSLALVTAACSFRATVKPQTTKEHVQSSTQRLKGPAARYTIATVSSVFHFVGVLYLVGYAPVGFPALQQINRWMFFAVACLLALAAAVYSFRAIVKLSTTEKSNLLHTEAVKPDAD
jgi:hypothetical protein